jgi:mono/diheme cytochrome c family protein
MKPIRHFAILVLPLAALACKDSKEQASGEETPSSDPRSAGGETPPDDADLLARGEYIAAVTGCKECHTPFDEHGPNPRMAYAGGLEVPEPFGTWRSTNITQDEATGIGSWTDEQIIDAIRQGVRPDGERLFPIMPYTFYNMMSDEDARALVAYLRTIDPIENEVERATDLKMSQPEMPPATGEPVPADDPVARGGYLVAMMHCAVCHSPPGEHGAPDMSRALQGGFHFELPMFGEGVLYSTNLTPDDETGIGEYSDEELVNAIRQMRKRDGSLIVGPMALYQSGWYQLRDEDADAIVAYLRSLPPVRNEIPESTFRGHAPPI